MPSCMRSWKAVRSVPPAAIARPRCGITLLLRPCAPNPAPRVATQTALLAAEKEREASVNNSKPFLMMKQMLTRKNAQLAELRAALRKHEGGGGDDDGDVVERGGGAGAGAGAGGAR